MKTKLNLQNANCVRQINNFRIRKLANLTPEESDSDSEADNKNVKDNGLLNSIKAAEIALKKIK